MATKKNTDLLAAYLVVGDDALKREAVIRRLRQRLEQLGDIEFNSDILEGATTTGDVIVSACQTIPFASDKRLVQVNDAEKLKKADSEAVVEYLKDPNPTTVLCLVAEKLAKNTRLYKAVASVGKSSVIECGTPPNYKMSNHVRSMAPTHGITLTQGAADKLVDLAGTDTVHLDNELKKIAVAHAGSDPVTERDVEALVAHTAEVKPWEFVDAFAARDVKRALSLYRHVEGSSPYALLAMCVSRLRELICASSLAARGNATNAALAQALGVNEWRVKNHFANARRFGEERLRAALISSYETERKMKSGTQPDAAFIDWIVEAAS